MKKLIVIILLLNGCATPPKNSSLVGTTDELPSIQEKYKNKLSKVRIGMTLTQYKLLFPEAYVGGQRLNTTAYELKNVQKYVTQSDMDRHNFWVGFGSPRSKTKKQVLWFYFYKDILLKWGLPRDWPSKPDVIIEKRYR